MGLIADSLDMFADAIIFGISLFVIGKETIHKKTVAKISSYFQLTLAAGGMIEVARRFLGFTEIPNHYIMMLVSFFALIGNIISLYLIQKAKAKLEVHIQAGKIFLANDVIINIGVIIAGAFVFFTHSKLPDLIAGSIVFVIVSRGAFRLFKLSK
jgi:Co/Zn/Cd efflux system component